MRVRQRTVVEMAKDSGRARRTFAGLVRWGGDGAETMSKPSSSLRCAQENGEKGNQDWVSFSTWQSSFGLKLALCFFCCERCMQLVP